MLWDAQARKRFAKLGPYLALMAFLSGGYLPGGPHTMAAGAAS